MKWIVRYFLITVIVFVAFVPELGFSKLATIHLDLAEATHYHHTSAAKIYIDLDHIVHEKTATSFATHIHKKVHYPVKLDYENGFYKITVGPIHSAADVRKTALTLKQLSKTKYVSKYSVKRVKHTTKKVKPTNKSKKHISISVNTAPIKHVPEQQPTLTVSKTIEQPSTYTGFMPKGKWLLSAGAGEIYTFYKSEMTIRNGSGAPGISGWDIYSLKQVNQPLVMLAAGYRFERETAWIPAFSTILSYQHLFSTNVGGNVMQYSNPAYTNYTYDWEVASDSIMALLKVNIYDYKSFAPYVFVGAGGGYNSTSNYSEGALPGVIPRINPAFESYSNLQFAYQLGLGIDYQVNNQIIVSAQYQYEDLGSIASKHGVGTWSGQLLSLGSYRSNGGLLSVTYLIDKQLF